MQGEGFMLPTPQHIVRTVIPKVFWVKQSYPLPRTESFHDNSETIFQQNYILRPSTNPCGFNAAEL